MTTNLCVIANVKQLRTGGSFRILLPVFWTSWGVGVLNSAIFNSFQIGLSLTRFWRAFGISEGWVNPPPSVCHCLLRHERSHYVIQCSPDSSSSDCSSFRFVWADKSVPVLGTEFSKYLSMYFNVLVTTNAKSKTKLSQFVFSELATNSQQPRSRSLRITTILLYSTPFTCLSFKSTRDY